MKLARLISDECKPCVIVINKWDLAKHIVTDDFTEYISRQLPGLAYAPIVYTSALHGDRIHSVVRVAKQLFEQGKKQWPTAQINRLFEAALRAHRPRVKSSKLPKIYYATQAGTSPPTFIVFVNRPEFFVDSYRRYLVNFLRKKLDVPEIPLRVIFKARRPDKKR